MSTESILNDVAAKAGWNADSKLTIALEVPVDCLGNKWLTWNLLSDMEQYLT